MTPDKYFTIAAVVYLFALFFLGMMGPGSGWELPSYGYIFCAVALLGCALVWPLFVPFILGVGIRKAWKWWTDWGDE